MNPCHLWGKLQLLLSLLNEERGLFLQVHHLHEQREKFAMTVLTTSEFLPGPSCLEGSSVLWACFIQWEEGPAQDTTWW